MSKIFDELDRILKSINEAEEPVAEETAKEKAEKMVKSIPINPEMETADQGKKKAWEKICKYFYDLSMGSMPGGGLSRKDDIDIPDDFLDPKMKGKISGKMEDKEFEKNTVVWDEDKEMEKLEKDVEVHMQGESDEFDDFDYRDNTFADDADMDDVDTDDMDGGSGGGGSSSKSEHEKLRDTIDDALDEMSDSGDLDGDENGQESGQKSGQQSGGQQSGNESGGQQSGGKQSGSQGGQEGDQEGGQEGGQDGGQDGGQEGGQDGGQQSGSQSGQQSGSQSGNQEGGSQDGQEGGQGGQGSDQEGEGGGSDNNSNGDEKPGGHHGNDSFNNTSKKDQRLKELKDAIDKGDADAVQQNIDDIREGGTGKGELAGERIGEVSDKDLRGDMEKAGISKKDIEEMSKASKEDPSSDMSEEDMDRLRKTVVDGLEKKCASKGGSALAKTIVKNALKSKVNDDEWRNMLKLFLKSRAVNNGDMSKAERGLKYGHKNHLWRDAVLPTSAPSKGQIQTIYCFVDFSGSVEQDLVYVFLGRVIDLCAELNYTDVVIYGFGEHIVLPRKIDGRMLKKQGKDVVLAQTWDYITTQKPGWGTENFRDVAHEIMQIRKRQRDAVYLIFGDAFWGNPTDGPMCLKTICGDRLLDRMCVLTYYQADGFWFESFKGYISMLKELVGLKNVITTKVSHIREE